MAQRHQDQDNRQRSYRSDQNERGAGGGRPPDQSWRGPSERNSEYDDVTSGRWSSGSPFSEEHDGGISRGDWSEGDRGAAQRSYGSQGGYAPQGGYYGEAGGSQGQGQGRRRQEQAGGGPYSGQDYRKGYGHGYDEDYQGGYGHQSYGRYGEHGDGGMYAGRGQGGYGLRPQGYAGQQGFGHSGVGSHGHGQGYDHQYRNWRDRQMQAYDEDFRAFNEERQKKFEAEFDEWRQNRSSGQGSESTSSGASIRDDTSSVSKKS
jgi:hypothetical protein